MTLRPGDKVELHCHVDGVLSPAMLAALQTAGHALPLTPAALAAVTPVRSMAAWLGPYGALVEPCLTPVARILPMLEWHVRDLVRQQVVYAEVMLSRLLGPPDDPGVLCDRLRAFRATADAAAAGALEIGLLVAIGRGPRARAERQAEKILTLARAGLICGVAIAGDEAACSIASIADLLDRFRDAGLGIEIHAGETMGPDSVWDALEHGRPDRLGHGVRAFEDERLVAALCEREVHLEMCPTSNLCLGVVGDLRTHPIARARALGMSYSVNTDDPGPFGCTLESELALLGRILGFGTEDFAAIAASAWNARFA